MKALMAMGMVMLVALLGGCGGYAASGDRDAAATSGSNGSGVTVFGTIDAGVSRTTTRTDR